jgi:hypothetical protein
MDQGKASDAIKRIIWTRDEWDEGRLAERAREALANSTCHREKMDIRLMDHQPRWAETGETT